ncbi:retinal cone rhodopsin-sensitive cGMP 3',5'-cyclic phosphodiesterase subunit gamma-like [Scyliorhinus canicula]|uniref:retinal cone rhodopsin-sensitive cGMP 3',5'-cyclic phosphodiesterase subunit gamma-like n=1 Tax=Scyliorhinus canicula TaxID=7830 RepID=UPI0018F6EF8D|nr:retinal cone rhodopsin-sensitive cGMP 3',5'-cyclic phosphodiesterase subunit gamma-like [Scyliorhinus canicula]
MSTMIPPANISGCTTSPRKGPPKFKQRATRQFKSKPPKAGVRGAPCEGRCMDQSCRWFIEAVNHRPLLESYEWLATNGSVEDWTHITVICRWEAFSHLELHELAQYGIV